MEFEDITGMKPTPMQEAILGRDHALRQTGRTTAKAFVAIREATTPGTTVRLLVSCHAIGENFLERVAWMLEEYDWPEEVPGIRTIKEHGIYFDNNSYIYIWIPPAPKKIVKIFDNTELLNGIEGTI